MELEEAHAPPANPHGLEYAIAVLQSTIAAIDGTRPATVDPRAHSGALSARSIPSALARVSASSCSGLESATMPAPARKASEPPVAVMVRIRMLRSQLPSRFRYPIAPV